MVGALRPLRDVAGDEPAHGRRPSHRARGRARRVAEHQVVPRVGARASIQSLAVTHARRVAHLLERDDAHVPRDAGALGVALEVPQTSGVDVERVYDVLVDNSDVRAVRQLGRHRQRLAAVPGAHVEHSHAAPFAPRPRLVVSSRRDVRFAHRIDGGARHRLGPRVLNLEPSLAPAVQPKRRPILRKHDGVGRARRRRPDHRLPRPTARVRLRLDVEPPLGHVAALHPFPAQPFAEASQTALLRAVESAEHRRLT